MSSPWQGPIIIASRRGLCFEAVVWSSCLFIEFCLEILPHVSPLKDEQREVVVRLLRSKNFVSILPTGFGKILIYQPLSNVKGNANAANDVVVTVSPLAQKE